MIEVDLGQEAIVRMQISRCAGCQNARDLGLPACKWHTDKLTALMDPTNALVDVDNPYGNKRPGGPWEPRKERASRAVSERGRVESASPWRASSRATYEKRLDQLIKLHDPLGLAQTLKAAASGFKSREEAARKMGISPYTLAKLCSGQRDSVAVHVAKGIARLLKVPVTELGERPSERGQG